MQLKRAKFFILIFFFLFTLFLSNDFGLIDVEKTSIITALAVDKEEDYYVVTAQIAVPEAIDAYTENKKAQLSGKGKTIGEALKYMADVSGWFPKLAFCNLIILGNNVANENVVKVLDYFAKTLRLQDSALVAVAQDKASDILSFATPLDNLSSFAIQKIILKASGFDKDVASTDIKTFCSYYYSPNSSGYMPLIKVVKAENGDSGGQSGSSSSKSVSSASSQGGQNQKSQDGSKESNILFDARTTALFKNGVKVGELSPDLTFAFNTFHYPMTGSSISVENVLINEQNSNYLLTIFDNKHSFKVNATNNEVVLDFDLSLFCKVADVNAIGTEESISATTPLPKEVIQKANQKLTDDIKSMVYLSVSTGCDFLRIKEKLYRFNYSKYSLYKDNFLTKLKVNTKVNVHGQE